MNKEDIWVCVFSCEDVFVLFLGLFVLVLKGNQRTTVNWGLPRIHGLTAAACRSPGGVDTALVGDCGALLGAGAWTIASAEVGQYPCQCSSPNISCFFCLFAGGP